MISENTYFYLYSSLLQAQAAILSLLSVFIILKIQNLKQDIDYCVKFLDSKLEVDKFKNMPHDEKLKYIDSENDRLTNNNHNTTKIYVLKGWVKNDEEIHTIKRKSKFIMYLLVSGMGIDCIGILFSIKLNQITFWGIVVSALVIIFFLLTLFKVVKTSIEMI